MDFEYDSVGYIAKSSKDALNLLVIPDYNVIVVSKDEKYTLLNENGKRPFNALVDDIYMIITGGQKHYYMTANNNTYDVEDYLDRIGVKTNNQQNSSQNNNANNEQQQENQEQNGEQQEGQEQQENQEQNGEQQEGQEQQGNQEQNGEQQENQEQNQQEQQENQEQSLIENNNEENQE